MKNVLVVGAGVAGRVIALEMCRADSRVTLVECKPADDLSGASFVAGGMLAPFAELVHSELCIHRLGLESTEYWGKLLGLGNSYRFAKLGTLIVAHHRERSLIEDFVKHLEGRVPSGSFQELNQSQIRALEPELGSFLHAVYLPAEGCLDPRWALAEVLHEFRERGGVVRFGSDGLSDVTDAQSFDFVIDCRGLVAQHTLSSLRGVKGEILTVRAPDVRLQRPIRYMHPRYPLYIVPRSHDRYVIGATMIEGSNEQGVTVRSCLELLSAAFAVHSGFGSGTLESLCSQMRPAFPDNMPKILIDGPRIFVNGLFRHGFLLAPGLARLVRSILLENRSVVGWEKEFVASVPG